MTQRIKPYEVLKSYENIPSWRNIFPQLEKNISLTGEKYFLSYGKYVTKVTPYSSGTEFNSSSKW